MKTFNLYCKSISFFLVILLIFSTSCKKLVQIPPPNNLIGTSAVFADSTDAVSGIKGMYIYISQYSTNLNLLNGGVTVYTGLMSDELSPNTGIAADNQFYTNAVSSPSNSPSDGFWNFGYTVIYQANACIKGIAASTISNSLKNQLTGEAKVVRALCYFNLVNLYGAVPLVTTTNYQLNATLPRVSSDQIYQQIITDLVSAQTLLSNNYPSSGRVRPNKYTATALLSKVYLYQKDWNDAYTQAASIINSSSYGLETDLNNVFLAGSSEAIWQLPPLQSGIETAEGYDFVPSQTNVIPQYTINSYLLSAFELNDKRKINWLAFNTVNGQNYYYPYKYKLGDDNNSTPVENYMMFRLGEQYLIRAEAEVEGAQGSPGISGAIADLNIIRNRAGLPPYTGSTNQVSVLTAIYHERQVELFCEWGNRWFDLKRSGNVNIIMGTPGNICQAKGGTWNPDWQLLPVPFTQLQLNPFLVQNPGY
jgi:hypothetical protein